MAHDAYISGGLLRPCEKRHHGVSTNPASQKRKFIQPIKYQQGLYALIVKDRIRKIIQKYCPGALKKHGELYLHFEIKSKVFKIIDDLEILLVPEKCEIHFRSVARKWWDFGRNKKRVNMIKRYFAE